MLTPIDWGHDSGGSRTVFRRNGATIPIDWGQNCAEIGKVSAMNRKGVPDEPESVSGMDGKAAREKGIRNKEIFGRGKRVRDLRCCFLEPGARKEAVWQGDGSR